MRKLFPLVGLGCAVIIVVGMIVGGILMLIYGAQPLLEKWRSSKSSTTPEVKIDPGNQPRIPVEPPIILAGVNLADARKEHTPVFRPVLPGPNKGKPPVKPDDAELTTYLATTRTGIQKHHAYVSKEFGVKDTHPVIVWVHDGFDGINPDMWKMTKAFRDAKFIVFCPSFRGEHNNPGQVETFYGEVDDLLSAIEHAAKLPEADPKQIYVVGYKAGATLSLLAATTGTTTVRAFFALAPIADMDEYARVKGADNQHHFAFSHTNPTEVGMRSAIRHSTFIQSPTFLFVPQVLEPQATSAVKLAQLASRSRVPCWSHVIPKSTPDNIDKVLPAVLEKLRADRGGKATISFTTAQLQKLFD